MRTLLVLMLAGCYGPSVTTGAPCSASTDCPRELVCSAASRTCERTDVDAGSDALVVDDCWAKWLDGTATPDTPAIIAQLSTSLAEGNISLADGDLTVFFSRPSALGGNDVFRATRTTPTGVFATPMQVGELSTPSIDGRLTLSADGSFGVLASERVGGLGASDLWSTSRIGGVFTVPTQKAVEDLVDAVDQFDPELSPDGLTLYYTQAAQPGQVLMAATRATTADNFASPAVIPIEGASTVIADPTVSPDGRVIVFASDTPSNSLDLYVVTRSNLTTKFTPARRLPINSPQIDADPELARDGCTLAFSSNRTGGRDLWISAVR